MRTTCVSCIPDAFHLRTRWLPALVSILYAPGKQMKRIWYADETHLVRMVRIWYAYETHLVRI